MHKTAHKTTQGILTGIIISFLLYIIAIPFFLPSYEKVKKYNDIAAAKMKKETWREALGLRARFNFLSITHGCGFDQVSVEVMYFKDMGTRDVSKKRICLNPTS